MITIAANWQYYNTLQEFVIRPVASVVGINLDEDSGFDGLLGL